MNIKSVLVLLAFGLSACSSGRYAGVPKEYHALIDRTIATAGDNAKELERALKEVPRNEREGMAFLISYMPERDARSLPTSFLRTLSTPTRLAPSFRGLRRCPTACS